MSDRRPPGVGDRVGGYRIEGIVGAGGMGTVYAATHLVLGRRVALKMVLGAAARDEAFLRRFEREAGVLARLDSPHVIAIFDHGMQDERPWIATQLASGGDLGRLVSTRAASGRPPLDPATAVEICAQVCDALSAAHQVGVIHRDIKPANVLLRDDRLDRPHVYLCDFGVADAGGTGLTTPGAIAGTWNYLAPERARGLPATAASDVYAVGCLLVEVLTGRPPYAGSDVDVAGAHLAAPVPRLPGRDAWTGRANELLAALLAKDPTARPATAALAARELRGLAGPTPRARRGRRAATALGALATVGVVGAGLVVWSPWSTGDSPAADVRAPTSESSDGGAPHGPSTPAPSPAPVSGDRDGDGLGDVTALEETDDLGSIAHLYRSSGSRLQAGRTRRYDGTVLAGDVDGDGRPDVVETTGAAPLITVRVALADGGTVSGTVRSASSTVFAQDFETVGDFDGDGHADLAIATRLHGRTIVTVALGTTQGRLVSDGRWYTGGRDGLPPDDRFYRAGDFDGDGDDDLVELTEHGESGVMARVLVSGGSAFTSPQGPRVSAGLDYYDTAPSVGDLDADGTDELVSVGGRGEQQVVDYSLARDRFARAHTWWSQSNDSSQFVTFRGIDVSDVDGDGRPDVVLIDDDERLRVLLNAGTRLHAAAAWTTKPVATYAFGFLGASPLRP